MGTLRINMTNGTSYLVPMDNFVTVEVADASKDSTLIRGTDAAANNTNISIERFGANENLVWPDALKAAYESIAIDPVQLGYPDLGNTWEDYLKYDIAKFGDAALTQALAGDVAPETAWSEKTAIAIQFESKEAAEKAVDVAKKIISDAESEATAIIDECQQNTANGENYDGPCGTVEPLNGGQNDAGCQACGQSVIDAAKPTAQAAIGTIEYKHQYLFKQIGGDQA